VGIGGMEAGFGHGRGQCIGPATDQHDLPAFFEQGLGASFANAGTGASDEGNLTHGDDFR
jgi:hypothetical protein